MFKKIVILCFLLLTSNAWAEVEPNHESHEELRALLHGIETAINTEKYDQLAVYFHKDLHVTTINQQVITSAEGIESYFKEWFGPGGYLQKLNITLTPDALTRFYGGDNPTWGVVYGGGVEDYQLTDGRFLPMKTRWTATVVKDTDGKWKILTLHIGANFYDNPIYAATAGSIKYFTAGGVLAGLILGWLVTLIWMRRKNSART